MQGQVGQTRMHDILKKKRFIETKMQCFYHHPTIRLRKVWGGAQKAQHRNTIRRNDYNQITKNQCYSALGISVANRVKKVFSKT